MRRFIIVVCVLVSFLSGSAYVQNVNAGSRNSMQNAGGFFAISPATFTTPGKVNTLVPLSDGRMLVGGSFVTIGGQAAPRSLAVIYSDGSLDTSFRVDPNLQVYEVRREDHYCWLVYKITNSIYIFSPTPKSKWDCG